MNLPLELNEIPMKNITRGIMKSGFEKNCMVNTDYRIWDFNIFDTIQQSLYRKFLAVKCFNFAKLL